MAIAVAALFIAVSYRGDTQEPTGVVVPAIPGAQAATSNNEIDVGFVAPKPSMRYAVPTANGADWFIDLRILRLDGSVHALDVIDVDLLVTDDAGRAHYLLATATDSHWTTHVPTLASATVVAVRSRRDNAISFSSTVALNVDRKECALDILIDPGAHRHVIAIDEATGTRINVFGVINVSDGTALPVLDGICTLDRDAAPRELSLSAHGFSARTIQILPYSPFTIAVPLAPSCQIEIVIELDPEAADQLAALAHTSGTPPSLSVDVLDSAGRTHRGTLAAVDGNLLLMDGVSPGLAHVAFAHGGDGGVPGLLHKDTVDAVRGEAERLIYLISDVRAFSELVELDVCVVLPVGGTANTAGYIRIVDVQHPEFYSNRWGVDKFSLSGLEGRGASNVLGIKLPCRDGVEARVELGPAFAVSTTVKVYGDTSCTLECSELSVLTVEVVDGVGDSAAYSVYRTLGSMEGGAAVVPLRHTNALYRSIVAPGEYGVFAVSNSAGFATQTVLAVEGAETRVSLLMNGLAPSQLQIRLWQTRETTVASPGFWTDLSIEATANSGGGCVIHRLFGSHGMRLQLGNETSTDWSSGHFVLSRPGKYRVLHPLLERPLEVDVHAGVIETLEIVL